MRSITYYFQWWKWVIVVAIAAQQFQHAYNPSSGVGYAVQYAVTTSLAIAIFIIIGTLAYRNISLFRLHIIPSKAYVLVCFIATIGAIKGGQMGQGPAILLFISTYGVTGTFTIAVAQELRRLKRY